MEPGFGARQDDLGVPIAPQTTKLEIWVGPYGGPLKSTLHIAVSEASLTFDKKKKNLFWAFYHMPGALLGLGYKMN